MSMDAVPIFFQRHRKCRFRTVSCFNIRFIFALTSATTSAAAATSALYVHLALRLLWCLKVSQR
jgi:hypothetical protein